MNVYKNLLTKVKYMLATEKDLDIEERKLFQWQILTGVPSFEDFKFTIGKGGANTIFFWSSSDKESRELCLPDDAIKLLTKLSNSQFYCFALYTKDKKFIKAFILEQDAIKDKSKAAFIVGVRFNGKKRPLYTRASNLFGSADWQKI